MNIPFQRLSAIIKGRRGVSADTVLPVRGADALGRPHLADLPGQVGSVARDESSGASTEGQSAPENCLASTYPASPHWQLHFWRRSTDRPQ